MFADVKRAFRRAAKRMKGESFTIDDISTIRPLNQPGSTYTVRARRQYDSEYWKIYGPGSLALPRELCSNTIAAGLTIEQALDKLSEIENDYADKLRGKKGIPYNHFSKVRDLLPIRQGASAPAEPKMETLQAVAVRAPLTLKKPAANP
jgi:hypothetical protein